MPLPVIFHVWAVVVKRSNLVHYRSKKGRLAFLHHKSGVVYLQRRVELAKTYFARVFVSECGLSAKSHKKFMIYAILNFPLSVFLICTVSV